MALIKCKHCGNLISDKATRCPKCGCARNKDVDRQQVDGEIVVTGKPVYYEDGGSPQAKKHLLIALLVAAIVGGGYGWYRLSLANNTVSVTPSSDEVLQQEQEQVIIQEHSNTEEVSDTMGNIVNDTKDNAIVNVESLKGDNPENNAIESVKAKGQEPVWIQGTWLYTFPDGEEPETGDCTYCKVVIDGNYLTIVEKTCGNNEAYEYKGKWKYKDEGEGFFIYYYYYGGKGIEIDFDKELLILPRRKFINGNRVYEYLHKVSD